MRAGESNVGLELKLAQKYLINKFLNFSKDTTLEFDLIKGLKGRAQ